MIEFKVVLAWSLLTGVFLGIGNITKVLLWNHKQFGMMDLWLGWGVTIVFLQIWHLMVPVDWRAGVVITSFGLAGLCYGLLRCELISQINKVPWYLAVGGMIAFWLALHSTNQPGNCDSGLYHLNSVRWAKEYAIVPGLGNLHARLAFNQSYFLYVTLLDVGDFAHKSHQLASGLLVLWLLLRGVNAIRVAAQEKRRLQGWVIYDLVMIVPVLIYAINSGNISSPSPDLAIFMLGNVMASELIRILSARASVNWHQDEGMWIMMLLACIGITVKLSYIGVAFSICAVLLYNSWKVDGWNSATRLGVGMITIGVIVILPWMIRGVILSGYPVYPVAIGRVAVDWCVPRENINRSYELVRMWAMALGDTIPGECVGTMRGYWLWLMAVMRNKENVVVPIAMALAGMICSFCFRSLKSEKYQKGFDKLYFAVPCFGLAYWFFTAPDPRFGGAIFWMLGAGAVTCTLVQIPRKYAIIYLVFMSCLLLFHEIDPVGFVKPWKKDSGPARRVVVVERRTDSGMKVFVAPESECGRTWDSDLPSTPFFNPKVEQRVSDSMNRGFRMAQ